MIEHPELHLVCDHGIESGDLTPVGSFRWVEAQGEWRPVGEAVSPPGREAMVYADTITETFMRGDRIGFWDGGGEHREHYEIVCPTTQCGNRVRIPGDHLQMVLAALSARRPSRWFEAAKLLAPSVTESAITLTLAGLQRARDHADNLGLLRQHR